MTYKNTIISLLMLVATALAAWVTFFSDHPTIITAKPTLLPDAFMEDVSAIVMNKYGKPSMKIAAPKMIHYAENDTTHLISPQLTLYRQSPEPWYITSKHAKATQGIDLVHFEEDVLIHHAADQNNPATLIKTPSLLVHPNKKIAETNDPIMLIQPNTTIKATGMYADMNTGYIKLLSQARGEYVPTS